MPEELKVYVVDFNRRSLYMRYKDPVTGKQTTRSTGTAKKREAERIAAKWEDALREGRYTAPKKISWSEFRDRVDADYLPSLAKKSGDSVWTVLDSVEQIIEPARLSSLTSELIVKWQSSLRKKKLAEATIKSYSATLKATLRWANAMGLLAVVPVIRMPKRARSSDRQTPMKGRALTEAEYKTFLAAVEPIVGCDAAPSWKRLIRGLWVSGLRLGEALSLSWDDDDELQVRLSDEYVMLAIPAEKQKSNRDELLPIVPEFRDFLMESATLERTGYVFPLHWRRKPRSGSGRRVDSVSATLAAIGKHAGIIVSKKNGRTKFASAHDLRRSFGDRWAARVTSLTLKTLMRHASIETTERYYVTRNAQAVMDELENFASPE